MKKIHPKTLARYATMLAYNLLFIDLTLYACEWLEINNYYLPGILTLALGAFYLRIVIPLFR